MLTYGFLQTLSDESRNASVYFCKVKVYTFFFERPLSVAGRFLLLKQIYIYNLAHLQEDAFVLKYSDKDSAITLAG